MRATSWRKSRWSRRPSGVCAICRRPGYSISPRGVGIMDQPARCFAHPNQRLGDVRSRRIRLSLSAQEIPRRQAERLPLRDVAKVCMAVVVRYMRDGGVYPPNMCLFAMNQLIGTRRTMPPDATGYYRVERDAVACIHAHDILSAYSDHCRYPSSGASTPS